MIELGYINKEQPLEEFVEKMDYNVSTVNRLSKKVKSKIIRALKKRLVLCQSFFDSYSIGVRVEGA